MTQQPNVFRMSPRSSSGKPMDEEADPALPACKEARPMLDGGELTFFLMD